MSNNCIVGGWASVAQGGNIYVILNLNDLFSKFHEFLKNLFHIFICTKLFIRKFSKKITEPSEISFQSPLNWWVQLLNVKERKHLFLLSQFWVINDDESCYYVVFKQLWMSFRVEISCLKKCNNVCLITIKFRCLWDAFSSLCFEYIFYLLQFVCTR